MQTSHKIEQELSFLYDGFSGLEKGLDANKYYSQVGQVIQRLPSVKNLKMIQFGKLLNPVNSSFLSPYAQVFIQSNNIWTTSEEISQMKLGDHIWYNVENFEFRTVRKKHVPLPHWISNKDDAFSKYKNNINAKIAEFNEEYFKGFWNNVSEGIHIISSWEQLPKNSRLNLDSFSNLSINLENKSGFNLSIEVSNTKKAILPNFKK
jgi:hypothetical protein